MKNNLKKWFTLVELLVVITILAIISVVAYQNFGWATDKAVATRKTSDVATIETSLNQYFVDNNSYPAVNMINTNDTEKYWYNSENVATPSNILDIEPDWSEIKSVKNAYGGWKINWITNYSSKQIWAKWTISQATLWKKYLTKDLYDPELWDKKIKSTNKKLIDLWIGRYVYAVYKKPVWTASSWTKNNTGSAYNIAYTVKKEWTDDYITKIVWTYDKESCYENSESCPETLIWSWENVLKNEQTMTNDDPKAINQWIPYPLNY